MTKPKEKALNRAARKWGCALYRYTEPDGTVVGKGAAQQLSHVMLASALMKRLLKT